MVRVVTWTATALSLVSLGAANALPDDGVRAASSAAATVSSGPSCAQTPIVVPNGGFESGSLSPWVPRLRPVPSGTQSALEIVEGGYKSGHALQMSVGYSAEINQTDIPTCEATKYSASFAYKVLNATATCIIRAKAGTTAANTYSTTISPLLPGDWRTATFKYHSEVAEPYTLSFAVICQYLDSSATILLDDIQVKATGTLAAPGCPKAVELSNGGFDNGEFAPWFAASGTFGNPPQYDIISPGYNSPYALELDFAETNFTDWYFQQNFQNLCEGYQYNVSFALNWVNYTGPASNSNNGCSLTVLELGCAGGPTDGFYYASSTPGWQQHSYVCLAFENNQGAMDVEFECSAANPIPAFAVRLDNFNIELLPTPSSAG